MLQHVCKDTLLLHHFPNFQPGLTLDCGLAFRWKTDGTGTWHGVAYGKALTLVHKGAQILFTGVTQQEFDTLWVPYFDLKRDYTALYARFAQDTYLHAAIKAFPGIRILRQEPWEALCSFILSQNNNIPRIKGIIEPCCFRSRY